MIRLPKFSKKRIAEMEAGTFKPKPRKPLKRTKLKSKRKNTGQAEVFKEIWALRPHCCEVCNVNIPEATASNFSHLIPKGSYPDFMLDPRNILIKCKPCHDLWHQHGAAGLRYSVQWVHVVRLRDELHAEAQQMNKPMFKTSGANPAQ